MASWPTAAEVDRWLGGEAHSEQLEDAVNAVNAWLSVRCCIGAEAVVPEPVRQAAMMYTAKIYRRKDSADGVLGAADFDTALRVAALDRDAEKLLELYITPTIA